MAIKGRMRNRCRPGVLLFRFALVFLLAPAARPQQNPSNVSLKIDLQHPKGDLIHFWNYFGYDEPNYTYAPNGKKLLRELAALDASPVYVRVHNLLTSGDGSASLKWGSTNVYTEDASGNPGYSWEILDRIFDTFHEAGAKPLVEIGFMPEALSTHPQPYRHTFPNTSVAGIYTGWAYPPKDYAKWSELVYQFVRHLQQRYGDAEVRTWLWEVWNEPDIGYWQGAREEFFKLYDLTVESVLRAFPEAKIGGPDSTGPGSSRSAEFLRAFLDHCAHQKNYATGKTGSHLDFISFHPKGSPKWQGDHVRMGIKQQLVAIDEGFKIVASFPEWRDTPIILGESDPEGCAACSAKQNPQNLYRNGPLYGAYTLEVLHSILDLAGREHVNLKASVTWAFEFEDQPPFAGFRELATSGIDKPVLNAFRMLGLLGSQRLDITSSAALLTEEVVQSGVIGSPDIDAIAARNEHAVELLAWNYHDDDVPFPASTIDLVITNLPPAAKRAFVEHFRVDSDHSNAFAVWRGMGSPESLSNSQLEQLQNAGQLQLLTSPGWVEIEKGQFVTRFTLPRQAVSLIRLSW
jgi:xylan 1,4-beta-xylosidase